jgi:anti-sigma B factor antagonist
VRAENRATGAELGKSDSVELNGATFSRRLEHDAVIIEVGGQIDLSNAELLASQIREAEETDAARIVLDLGPLEFIDSTGLKELLIAQRRNDEDSDRMRLRNVHGNVAHTIGLTQLDAILKTED